MSGSMEANALLAAVRTQSDAFRSARQTLTQKAMQQVEAQLAEMELALEKAVIRALEQNTVTDVAAAFTPLGTPTPNRNAIYAIKRKHDVRDSVVTTSLPFEWEPRVVDTVNGPVTVFDLVGVLTEFGPLDVSGIYRWAWDSGRLDPILDGVQEPYPTTRPYTRALEQYVLSSPYPGGD